MNDAEMIALAALTAIEAVQMEGENQQRLQQGYSPAWVPGCGCLAAGSALAEELRKRGILL